MTRLTDGKVLLPLNDGVSGDELWVSDGTAAGTFLLQDIRSGSSSSFPRDITPLGRRPGHIPGLDARRCRPMDHGWNGRGHPTTP